jgi:hypothetical protein
MKTATVLPPQEHAQPEPDRIVTATFKPLEPWAPLCNWFTRNFRGMEGSLERIDRNNTFVVEFQDLPLVAMRSHFLANGVPAIALTFATGSHQQRYELTAVQAIHFERDAAGFPTVVEFVCENEKVVLRFTGDAGSAPTYTRNSWGE